MAYMNRSKLVIDKDVRHSLYEYLRPRLSHRSMFIHELAFQVGKEEGRVDLVAVDNLLQGFEIKSDADSLTRLKRQVRLYGKVMNQMSVVVTLKHLRGAKKIIPAHWGIYTYDRGFIEEVRDAGSNDSLCYRSLAGLLWRDSALQLLSDSGLERGFASKAKGYMHDHIFECVDSSLIQEAVCRQLRSHRRSI